MSQPHTTRGRKACDLESLPAEERGQNGIAINFTALVVDDNAHMLQLAAAMVKMLGYKIRTAKDGHEALFQFQHSLCELVLTDFDMPAIDGYQLARWVKLRVPETRVVIMTGKGPDAVAAIMKDACIDGWLFKPFNMQELKTVLLRAGLPSGFDEGPCPVM